MNKLFNAFREKLLAVLADGYEITIPFTVSGDDYIMTVDVGAVIRDEDNAVELNYIPKKGEYIN